MKLTLSLLTFLTASPIANAGIKEIGVCNGVHIVRIRSAGFFCPSATSYVTYTTNAPGVLTTLHNASSPGAFPAVMQAAGIVGGAAALGTTLKPVTTKVQSGNLHNETFAQGGEAIIH